MVSRCGGDVVLPLSSLLLMLYIDVVEGFLQRAHSSFCEAFGADHPSSLSCKVTSLMPVSHSHADWHGCEVG